MRLLVVGGTGYFGARLSEVLRNEHEVTVTHRSLSPARAEWIKRTALNAVSFDSAADEAIPVKGVFDVIINLAMPGATEAGRDSGAALERALATAKACVRLLDDDRAKQLVHFSTFHVYGAGGREKFDESDVPAPVHPYGQTHWACEQMLAEDERVCLLRASNLVGAPAHADLGDQAKLLFLDLCRQAANGAIKLHNDGLSFRDFLPFDDAIDAVKLLLQTPWQAVRLFNLASGNSMRLDEIAVLIQHAAPNTSLIEYGTGQDAFRSPFSINIERLRALGWQPRASLTKDAAAIVKFFS